MPLPQPTPTARFTFASVDGNIASCAVQLPSRDRDTSPIRHSPAPALRPAPVTPPCTWFAVRISDAPIKTHSRPNAMHTPAALMLDGVDWIRGCSRVSANPKKIKPIAAAAPPVASSATRRIVSPI